MGDSLSSFILSEVEELIVILICGTKEGKLKETVNRTKMPPYCNLTAETSPTFSNYLLFRSHVPTTPTSPTSRLRIPDITSPIPLPHFPNITTPPQTRVPVFPFPRPRSTFSQIFLIINSDIFSITIDRDRHKRVRFPSPNPTSHNHLPEYFPRLRGNFCTKMLEVTAG